MTRVAKRLFVAVLLCGCSGQRGPECANEVKLLDGGNYLYLNNCIGSGLYDCAAELDDAGMTATWRRWCDCGSDGGFCSR